MPLTRAQWAFKCMITLQNKVDTPAIILLYMVKNIISSIRLKTLQHLTLIFDDQIWIQTQWGGRGRGEVSDGGVVDKMKIP